MRDCFVINSPCPGQASPVSATGKNRKRETGTYGPDVTIPIEKSVEFAADISARSGQTQRGKKGGFCHADSRVRCGELPFCRSHIRTTFKQLGGQPRRHFGNSRMIM